MNEDELKNRRERKAKRDAGEAILEALGGPPIEQLAELVSGAPDQIAEAMLEAVERGKMYRALTQLQAETLEAQGIPPDYCANAVCRDFVPANTLKLYDEKLGDYEQGDPASHSRCGANRPPASCLYRMTEGPPCDPFTIIPSHAEAIRMLARAGLHKPDDFGHWNGTDFAHRGAVSRLWFKFIEMLVDAGKIEPSMFVMDDGEEVPDRSKRIDSALVYLGFPKH